MLPRGIRNNNFGNIEDGPFARSIPGYVGSDGRFAIFNSPEAGLNAMERLLASYSKRGLNSVSAVINRWAPPSDGNPVSAYAAHVAGGLGVDPNAPIDLSNPEVRRAVALKMAEFENGPQAFKAAFQGGGSLTPPQVSLSAPTASDASTKPPVGFSEGGIGALFGLPNGRTSGGYDLAGALQGAGASLMAIDNPQGAAALSRLVGNNRQNAPFQFHMDPRTGTLLRFNPNTGQAEVIGKGKPAETTLEKAVTEMGVKTLAERQKVATDALASLQSNAEARAMLDKGIITGFGAEWKLAFGKALQSAGFHMNDDAIANTEAFVSSRALEIGRLIKNFGAGTGLSDEDRNVANRAAAGDITYNEESIRKVLDVYDKASRNAINTYNKQIESLGISSPFLQKIEIPDLSASSKASGPAGSTFKPDASALRKKYGLE